MSHSALHSAQESGRLIRRTREMLQGRSTLCVCMSLYWAWQLSFFQSPAVFFQGETGGSLWLAKVCLLAASAATYGVAWRFHVKLAGISRHRAYPAVLALLMCAGSAALLTAERWESHAVYASTAAEIGGGGLMGVSAALFVVELGRIFAQLGPLSALICGVVGIFGGALLHALLFALPNGASQAILCIIAAAIPLVYARIALAYSPARYFGRGLTQDVRFPARYALTCLIQGVVLGTTAAILGMREPGTAEPMLYVLAFAAGGVLVFVASMVFNLDFNHLVYQVGFPVMAGGFVLLACLPDQPAAGGFVFTAGYCFIYVIITCINSYFGSRLECSPAWIVSLSTFFLVAGQAASVATTSIVFAAANGQTANAELVISVVLAFAIPTAALFLLSSSNPTLGWGAIRPSASADNVEELFERIAKKYHLTPRETEITELLSRGRNKEYISNELNLAKETVKSHMSSIYKKLFVHSQQELIDLVEDERDRPRDSL